MAVSVILLTGGVSLVVAALVMDDDTEGGEASDE